MELTMLAFYILGTFAFANGAGGGAGGHGSEKSGIQGHSGSSDTTKLVRIGYPMPLECKITTEANAKLYKWFKDGDLITQDHERYKVFNDNATLLIPLAAQEDVGVYRCQAASKSFEISVVYLTYKNLPKSLTVLEGDKLSISCDVEGNPMPKITWYKNGANVDEVVNATRYSLEQNEKGTDNATFLIEEAIYDDRAEYGCFITSGDLQFNTTTFVRVKDMYAALWPFLGICVEVFILCLIIFIYEKRRAKADFEESDTDQPPEQKNTPDLNKDSIRHRK